MHVMLTELGNKFHSNWFLKLFSVGCTSVNNDSFDQITSSNKKPFSDKCPSGLLIPFFFLALWGWFQGEALMRIHMPGIY